MASREAAVQRAPLVDCHAVHAADWVGSRAAGNRAAVYERLKVVCLIPKQPSLHAYKPHTSNRAHNSTAAAAQQRRSMQIMLGHHSTALCGGNRMVAPVNYHQSSGQQAARRLRLAGSNPGSSKVNTVSSFSAFPQCEYTVEGLHSSTIHPAHSHCSPGAGRRAVRLQPHVWPALAAAALCALLCAPTLNAPPNTTNRSTLDTRAQQRRS